MACCFKSQLCIKWVSLVGLQCGGPGFNPWVENISWRGTWQSTPVFLPGASPYTEAGYSPRDHTELNTIKWLSTAHVLNTNFVVVTQIYISSQNLSPELASNCLLHIFTWLPDKLSQSELHELVIQPLKNITIHVVIFQLLKPCVISCVLYFEILMTLIILLLL